MKCFLLCSKVMLRVTLLLLIGWAALTPARADNLYARIHGTVTDSSGAVVPDVTVIAFNNGTGLVRTVRSDASGNFEFIQLPIGTYKVSASKNGFKKQESNGITLVLDQNYALPIQMEVGTTAETITVEANAVQVETTSNQKVVQGDNRRYALRPELNPASAAANRRGGNFRSDSAIPSPRQQARQNGLIDGIDDNDIMLNNHFTDSSPDAIAEFNKVTNTINAVRTKLGSHPECGDQVGDQLISWRPV